MLSSVTVKVGDAVSFGRKRGATAYGTVERVSNKTATVRLTKQYNSNPPGVRFRVPFSLLSPVDEEAAKPDVYPIGLTITGFRMATDHDLEVHGFDHPWSGDRPAVLVLSDGSTITASQDYEGNGPGALFGWGEIGSFVLYATEGEVSDAKSDSV